ncbi:hypothetical protein [Flavobacterium sp. KMS]|uniref:hypothetical protein n=1 Tax=Flavobacterium sp. KMS TaxID=1566023 RepID=UPI001038EF62|nr:hypothetical protein [Flavobacterium sp. KMS]
MKKRLHTSFIKFIVEKYDKEIQELPEEETNYSKDISDEYDEIMDYGDEKNDEVQDEEETPENDDETIDALIKEYNSLAKKYKMKTNDSILNKRK